MKRVTPFSHDSIDYSPSRDCCPRIQNRRSLGLCGLSILLCLTALFGATFALFSDVITNENNRIQTGNLKVGLEVSDKLIENSDLDTSSPNYRDLKTAGEGAIFTGDASNWKPGDQGTKYFKISNIGTMPLNYRLSFLVEDGGLGGALTFTLTRISSGGEISGEENGSACVAGDSLETVGFSNSNMKKESTFDLYQMDYVLSESLDNSYNTDTPAFFDLDVTLHAQQITG